MIDYKLWVKGEDYPTYMVEDGLRALASGYLVEGETPKSRMKHIARQVELETGINGVYDDVFEALWKGWIGLASPVWSNFGRTRGLPISCFGSYVEDSILGFFNTSKEVAVMNSMGGGTSGFLGDVRSNGSLISHSTATADGVMTPVSILNNTVKKVSQGGVRRGMMALYLPFSHKDIMDFLEIREIGNEIQTITNAVCISKQDVDNILAGDEVALKTWARIQECRNNLGVPYILFTENANNHVSTPAPYGTDHYKILASNLCITGSQRVVTSRGYLTAEELHKQGGGLTLFDGENPVKASEMKLREKDVEVYTVTLENGMTHTITEYHKLPILTKKGVEVKSLSDLSVGDAVKVQCKKGLFGKKDVKLRSYDSIMPTDIWESNEEVQKTHLVKKMAGGFFKNNNLQYLQEVQLLVTNLGLYCEIEESPNGGYDLVKSNTKKSSKIKSIEYAGKEDVYCPTVYSEDHLFVANGFLTHNCNEIYLPSSNDESFVCCLSSLNLAKYDEWKDSNVIDTAVILLDAVMSEFIRKASKIEGMQKAVKFATRHRALGLGTFGEHSYLQENGIPFGSIGHESFIRISYSKIKSKALKSSERLAERFGACEVNTEYGINRRNTTLLAIAPTTTNALIGGDVSAGIEPIVSNVVQRKVAKSSFTKKNETLKALLSDKGFDDVDTWDSIIQNFGSVQHLDCLDDEEKEVFKTAYEINQYGIIKMASLRQNYLCQGQSLNLFILPNATAQSRSELCLTAYFYGLKGLYYQRSESTLKEGKNVDDVKAYMLKVSESAMDSTCLSCDG